MLLTEAIQALHNGKIIIYPTETTYGIGCDARRSDAVEKIFEIKNRTESKTLSLVVADYAMAARYGQFGICARYLAERYWPGALTIVVPAQTVVDAPEALAPGVKAGDGTVALRVSGYPIARELPRLVGAPIVATSANRSGAGTCYNIACVREQLGESAARIDLWLDAGQLTGEPPSTVVRVISDRMEVLRQGALRVDAI